MPGRIEKTYGRLLHYLLLVANPFKKVVVDTECSIHRSINVQALDILKNDKYLDAYYFFSDFISEINDGVTWADQDFKCSGHFYSPHREKGLYGNKDALSLALEYYKRSLEEWRQEDHDKSMFFLGATVHLIQDMTVPQHANIRLFDDHRQYENFIRRVYSYTPEFRARSGGYYLENIEEYIRFNARTALKIYNRFKEIEKDSERFYRIASYTLPLAQKTTAGCYMKFYRDASKMTWGGVH